MLRRRGGPGLLSTMARTAVIAGTATAVSNKVSSGQAAKASAREQQQVAAHTAATNKAELEQLRGQMESLQAQQATAATQTNAATQGGSGTILDQLQQLAQLKEAGMLTDEEFAAAKAKLLAG